MKSIIFLFILLNISGAFADDLSEAQNYLSNAQKEEIQQKAATEATEREFRRQKEIIIRHKQDLDRQTYAARQRVESLRNEQQKYASQIEGMKRETSVLQTREQQLKKEVERAEGQASAHQADVFRVQSQLEATQAQLKASNQALEERRQKALQATADAREKVAKWNADLASAQAEIVKSQILKLEMEKEISGVEIQISDLVQKQESVVKEQQMIREQVGVYAQEVEISKKNKEKVMVDLASVEKAREQTRVELKNMIALHQTQTKELNDSIAKLEASKKTSEQEKVQLEVEKRRLSESLNKVREKQGEAHVSLIKAENDTLKGQLAMAEQRSLLTKEVATNSGVLDDKKRNKPAPASEALMIQKAEKPKAVNNPVKEALIEPDTKREVSSEGNWRLSKLCNLYKEANRESIKLWKMPEGQMLKVEKGPEGFMKTIYKNHRGYVLEICGQYQ